MTGKLILNQQQHKVDSKNISSDTPSFKIAHTETEVNITISKSFIDKSTSHEITSAILISLSPLLMNKNKTITQPTYNTLKSFKHIAFFIEHMPHYTGGRYSIFHQAVLLSQYTKVTVVTNDKPPFYNDFKDYYNDNFEIITTPTYLGDNSDNKFDLIVGCPVTGGLHATEYAKRYMLPLYLIIFETPNWIQTMRDGVDASNEFWASYKGCLFQADKIITISQESKKHLIEWMKDDERVWKLNPDKDVYVIYPCINQIVADKVLSNHDLATNNKYNVVYISRMTPFKTLIPVLKKFSNDKYHFDIIGKIWKDELDYINKLDNVSITTHGKISDEEKFRIIAKASVLVFPTTFEGFGMPPMEALYCGVPVIAYELPVLKEVYKNSIQYVESGNVSKFIQAIKQICEGNQSMEQIDWVSNGGSFSLIGNATNSLLSVFKIPKISAGIIVYNGADYLEYAVKSIYSVVNQIIIVEGAVKGYAIKPNSTDETIKIVEKLKQFDVLNKIEFVQSKKGKFWNDKIEMQNEIAKRVTGDYYVKVDHDEIWKPETLVDVINMMENNKQISIVRMPFNHFWLNFKTVAKDAGGKWSTQHPRVWRWNTGFRHLKSFNFFNNLNKDGQKVGEPYVTEHPYVGDCIYHFGYVRKIDTLQNKIKYYKNRGIETFVTDTVSGWQKGMPTQPTQKVKSWDEPFGGVLPRVLSDHPYKEFEDIRQLKKE